MSYQVRTLPEVPQRQYGDLHGWRGIDQYNPPETIPNGYALVCDNLSIEGAVDGAGGLLAVRPGKQGRLAASFGTGIHALTPIIQDDGTTVLWFVTGASATTGKLYRLGSGATSATEILIGGISFVLTSANVRMEQIGGYVYLIDGLINLCRLKADGTGAETVTGLDKPSTTAGIGSTFPPFSASLTSLPFLAATDITLNTDYFDSGLDLVPASERNFPPLSTFWNYSPGADPNNTLDANGDNCVELDNAGEYAETDAIDTTADTGNYGDNATVYPSLFYVRCYVAGEDSGPDPTQQVYVTVTAYSATGGGGTSASRTVLTDAVGESGREFIIPFDFRDINTPILSVKVKFEQPYDQPGTRGVDVNHVAFRVAKQQLMFSADNAGNKVVTRGTVLLAGGTLYTGGLEFEHQLSSPQNLLQTQKLFFRFNSLLTVSTPIRLRPFLRDGVDRAYGPVYMFAVGSDTPGANGFAGFSLDITPFDAAILDNVTHIGFELLDDLVLSDTTDPDGPNTAAPLFSIGDITKPGNLSPDLTVYYRVVEMDAATDPTNLLNVIYSDGSDGSGEITPNVIQATGQIQLPGRTNAAADYFAVYRFGGGLPDNYGRLLVLLPFGTTDVAFGADTPKGSAPYYAAPANPYIQYDAPASTGAAGGVLIDNTPLSFLLNGELYQPGREAPPPAPRDICEFQGRLWLLVGKNDLYGSWLLSQDSNAGLYFTRVTSRDDPAAEIKGAYLTIGTDDNDRCQRILPMQDRMTILRTVKSPYILLGTDPTNFEQRPYRGDDGVGCLGPRAAVIWQNSVVYLGPNGLVSFNPYAESNGTSLFSLFLERLLNPNLSSSGAAAIAASPYSLSALWIHGGVLYFAAPVSGGSANSVIYRYDRRQRAWTRWLQGNVTGGCAVVGSSDTNDMYVAGIDGQVYRYVPGQGDKALSGSSQAGIAFELVTRQYGQEEGDSGAMFRAKTPNQFLLNVEWGTETVALTTSITGAVVAAPWSNTYTLTVAGGAFRLQQKPNGPKCRGRLFSSTISGTVTKRFTIGPLAIRAALGSEVH